MGAKAPNPCPGGPKPPASPAPPPPSRPDHDPDPDPDPGAEADPPRLCLATGDAVVVDSDGGTMSLESIEWVESRVRQDWEAEHHGARTLLAAVRVTAESLASLRAVRHVPMGAAPPHPATQAAVEDAIRAGADVLRTLYRQVEQAAVGLAD